MYIRKRMKAWRGGLAALVLLCYLNQAQAVKLWTETYDSDSVTLPANGHLMTVPGKLYRLPENAWVVEAEWIPINMPTYAVHHALVIAYREAPDSLLCMPGKVSPISVLFPMGRERSRIQLGYDRPRFLSENPVGIYVNGSVINIGQGVMLDNPDPWAYENVKMRIKMTFFQPDESGAKPKPLENILLNLGGGPWVNDLPTPSPHPFGICNTEQFLGVIDYIKTPDPAAVNKAIDDGIEFAIPAKTKSYVVKWKEELVVEKPMTIYYIWPHVHSHTSSISLLVNGKKIWSAPIVKSGGEYIIEIPTDHVQFELKPGDRMNVEAIYSNPYDRPYPQMGLLYLYYHSESKDTPVVVDEKKLRWAEEAKESLKLAKQISKFVDAAQDLPLLEKQMREQQEPFLKQYLDPEHAHHHHHDNRQSWKKGW